MDTFEIMSAVRNIAQKHSEELLPTPELLRCLNLAYRVVGTMLNPFYKDDLVVSFTETGISGDYIFPQDVLFFINVYRKNGAGKFKLATKLDIELKPLIGTNQYSSNENKPFFVQMGSSLSFTPALDSTDVMIEYRRQMSDLLFGIGMSSADKESITLDNHAPTKDDIINDYYLALYEYISGNLQLVGINRITDYDALGKKATISCPNSSQEYIYALVPIIPDDFHYLLVQDTLNWLALSGYVDKCPGNNWVMDQIKMIYRMRGMEYGE